MKFYRVHMSCDGGNSAGYDFFTTRLAADRCARDWIKDHPREEADVSAIEIEPTKDGILQALKQFAAHHDNG